MTSQQKKSIEELHIGYAKNCEKYVGWGSSSVCNFIVYRNESDANDKNIVVGMIEIDGISDNNQLFMKNQNILIEEDGSVYVLEDLFSTNKVITYLQKLKPFNWNE